MSEAAASQLAQPSSSSTAPTVLNKHAPTPLEQQRLQLERLLKDPSKPAHIPKAPVEKTLRTPREMMKNVQGSSAGAGSGEFHVYKQSRRREYERLKIMDEKSTKVWIYLLILHTRFSPPGVPLNPLFSHAMSLRFLTPHFLK